MPKLEINLIPIVIKNNIIDIYFSFSEFDCSNKRNISNFKTIVNSEEIKEFIDSENKEHIFFGFDYSKVAKHFTIDLEKERWFINPFIENKLKSYLSSKDLIVFKDFVNDLEIWEKQSNSDIKNFDKYNSFTIKICKYENNICLLLSYNKETYISQKPITEYHENQLQFIKKCLYNNSIINYDNKNNLDKQKCFPLLNKNLRKILEIKDNDNKQKPSADYVRYYNKIFSFYNTYLTYLNNANLKYNIQIYSSGFIEVSQNNIFYLARDKNLLLFKDNNKDVNVYNGINRYGPFKKPDDILNIEIFFIFHESEKNYANELYKFLKNGYKNFPGLEQFVGIPIILNKELSLLFKDNNDPIPEIEEKYQQLYIDENKKYIAIYISQFKKDEEDPAKQNLYFKIKEILIKKNISSQVIIKESISNQFFNYFLPNISIGILAKLKGIPWKLSREKEEYLVIGFGAYRQRDNEQLIGNTVCFDNEGLFHKFDVFQADVNEISQIILKTIQEYVNNQINVKKIIIHFYKELKEDESKQIEEILKKLNLNIPFVVLVIKETKEKEYLCFDMEYKYKMPMSGTIIQLVNKKEKEYLLYNNTRYEEYPTNRVDLTYPVKIKISSAKGININNIVEIKSLIDGIYQFSRMYWRSVKQKSNPVTVEYSKLIAKIVSHFEDNSLPNTDIAKSSLWFL